MVQVFWATLRMNWLTPSSRSATLAVRLLIILLVTAVGVVWLNQRGPLPVMRGTLPLPETVPEWYMLSAFPILGMLVADLVLLFLRTGPSLRTLELGFQIALLVTLSSMRIATAILLSGHVLLFTYFVVRRALVPFPETDVRRIEFGIGLALFCLISYVKLFWWLDWVTFLVAGVLGTLMACLSFLVWHKLGPHD